VIERESNIVGFRKLRNPRESTSIPIRWRRMTAYFAQYLRSLFKDMLKLKLLFLIHQLHIPRNTAFLWHLSSMFWNILVTLLILQDSSSYLLIYHEFSPSLCFSWFWTFSLSLVLPFVTLLILQEILCRVRVPVWGTHFFSNNWGSCGLKILAFCYDYGLFILILSRIITINISLYHPN
jgi:hypothetical protein